MLFGQRQDVFGRFLKLLLLIVINVRPLALGEPVYEKRLRPATKQDDGPVALRSPLPRSGDPLFDDLTAEVGVDLAFVGPSHRPGETLKPHGHEDPRSILLLFYSIWCYTAELFSLSRKIRSVDCENSVSTSGCIVVSTLR